MDYDKQSSLCETIHEIVNIIDLLGDKLEELADLIEPAPDDNCQTF